MVASKYSYIRVIDKTAIDKTASQVGKNLVDFEAIKRNLLSGENSSKISNNSPVVCTNKCGRVLSESEIKVLEKRLDLAPFQRKVNEPERRRLWRVL